MRENCRATQSRLAVTRLPGIDLLACLNAGSLDRSCRAAPVRGAVAKRRARSKEEENGAAVRSRCGRVGSRRAFRCGIRGPEGTGRGCARAGSRRRLRGKYALHRSQYAHEERARGRGRFRGDACGKRRREPRPQRDCRSIRSVSRLAALREVACHDRPGARRDPGQRGRAHAGVADEPRDPLRQEPAAAAVDRVGAAHPSGRWRAGAARDVVSLCQAAWRDLPL